MKGARLAIINGSPTDDNAHLVNKGIHSVLDPLFKSGARVKVAEQWTPGWDPPTAQREMEQILTKANNKVDGVVSANDGMAGGIIAALKAQGLAGKVKTTGQDASLEGMQNVILGYAGRDGVQGLPSPGSGGRDRSRRRSSTARSPRSSTRRSRTGRYRSRP